MKITFRKITHGFIYYLLPLSLAFLFYWRPNRFWFIWLGYSTIYLLGVILFCQPLAVLLNIKWLWKIKSYRRELGILSFWTFFFHAAGFSYLYQLYRFEPWPAALYWGAAAGLGMLILGVTSNTYAVRLLRRNWKRLHRIVYFVFAAALTHIALTRQRGYELYLIVFLIFFILKLLEWRKTKRLTRDKNL